MRKGFGLYGLVEQRIGENPLSGHLFVFCNRSRNRLKILYWDGSGIWICAKRLEKGRYSWPIGEKDKVLMDRETFTMLISGLELRKIERKKWYRR